MNERIKLHVGELFQSAPRTKRAAEIKDELIANLTDKYNDLIEQGKDEETAYSLAISSIGEIDDIISALRTQDMFNPAEVEAERKRTAKYTSAAIGIYIISIIFPLFLGVVFENDVAIVSGVAIMIIMWAAATMIMVYNGMTRPKYVKIDDTIVEDFKEWHSGKTKKRTFNHTLFSMLMTVATLIYLVTGFVTDMWHPTWVVYVLAFAVYQVSSFVTNQKAR